MTRIQTLLAIIAISIAITLPAAAANGPDRTAKKSYKKGLTAYEKADYEAAAQHLAKAIKGYPDYADAHYTLGQVFLARQQARQALAHFSKAAEIDPEHTDAQLALGRILLAARMPAEAQVRMDSILKREPANRDAIMIKGSALLSQNQSAAAIDLLTPVFDSGERDTSLILLLAGAHIRLGHRSQAETVIDAGLKVHPEAIPLHLQLANIHLRAGNLEEARRIMEKVAAIEPGNIAHAITLARLYWEGQDAASADRLLVDQLKANPENASARIAIANFYLEKQQADRARELLVRGIALRPADTDLRLALGQFYLNSNQPQQAVDLLKQGLDTTPAPPTADRIRLQNSLAGIYLAAHDPASAKTYAQESLALDPVNARALVTRGKASKATGRPEAAIPDFNQVLRRHPRYLDAYLQLADAYALNRQLDQSRQTLATALKLAPTNQSLLMAMYRVCLVDKDYKQAEANLRTLVEHHPDAVAAQAELGDLYLALNDTAAAKREYSEIVLKSPGSAVGHVRLARFYARQGNRDGAIAQLQRGYDRTGRTLEMAAELVAHLLAAERYDDALALCDRRLEMNGDDAFAYNLKGKTYTRMKKYTDAQKAFEKAADIAPMWPEAGNNLAAMFLLQDKKKQAIKHFQAALDRNPQNPTAYLVLGRLHEERSEFDKAIKIYEQAVGKVPGFWSAANRLAFLLADRATDTAALDRALKLATAAYRMKPGQAAIVDTLAWIYYKQGETKRALHLYEQLSAAAPDDPQVNYHMGMVLRKSGDSDGARQKLEIATRDDTDFVGRAHAEALLKEM
jgi:putative PEP-CTERM system TPR-repeat lipoprotein